nr:NADH dehydrogenase [ubiquinone] 1 alpha subcomplex assembly factor 2 [Zonotrichia albicollis]
MSANPSMLPSLPPKTAKKPPASDSSSTCQKAGFGKRQDEQRRAQTPVRSKRSTAARCESPWRSRADRKGGQIIPERRFVEAVNREAYQYQIGDFPAEWEAWIRKKREDPPTVEEILRNESYREEMKQKVKDVSEKDKLLQAKEYEEGLVAEPSHTQVKGHASAPYYGKKEPSQDPTSTANTFQPGAWMPPGSGSSQNK